MKLEAIIDTALEAGVYLFVKDSKLAYQAPKGVLSEELKQEIARNKAQITRYLIDLQESGQTANRLPEISAGSRGPRRPLSSAQKRLWFVDRLYGQSSQYNIPVALRLTGTLDEQALQGALDALVERHAALRSVYGESDGEPYQQPRPAREVPIRRLQLAGQPDEEVAGLAALEAASPFDLSHDLMLRATLIALSAQDHVLLLTVHHVAADGWSIGILVREFASLYSSLTQAASHSLAPLDLEYSDYAEWQQALLETELMSKELAYWKSELADLPQVHGLPLDRPRTELRQYRGRLLSQRIDHQLTRTLKTLCSAQGVTPFMLLETAFSVLLGRYSDETDIVVGTPIAGRFDSKLDPLVGFFINSLVIRTRLEGNPTFDALLESNKTNILNAYAHQHLPFEVLVEELKPRRALDHDPIFQIVFGLNNTEQQELALPALTISRMESEEIAAKVDLEVSVREDASELSIYWVYDSHLFTESSIRRLADSYALLLKGIAEKVDRPILAYPLMDSQSSSRLLKLGRGPQVTRTERTALDLLARGLTMDPQAVAARCAGQALSFGELEARANRLANYLQEADMGQGARVGIYLERSLDQLVAVLGVLKSGASYVPLDVESPLSRVQGMLSDAEAELVLLCSADLERLPLGGLDVLLMDGAASDADWLQEFDASAPQLELGPESEAYLLYTSGSTGKPKGVRISHGGLANYLAHAAESYFDEEIAAAIVSTPLCFDATLTTLLAPLCAGRTVELIEGGEGWLERLAGRLFESDEGLLFKLTPAHLDALTTWAPTEPNPVRHRLVVGGEQFGVKQLLAYKRGCLPQARFVNEYGPTETVVGCSIYEVDDLKEDLASRAAVPIGLPIANTHLYVLGADKGLSPLGSLGELCIGGAGVALGYVNGADQIQSRFVPDPYAAAGRMYRTGDRVRWLSEGVLEFVGRRDDQVKLRGYRVELGEVESALRACAGVRQAAAALRDSRLVAYLVDDGEASSSRIEAYRAALSERLPEYMVPAFFVQMEALPLTANGKVDRAALPEPDGSAVAAAEYEAPRNDLEARLCAVWAQVLGLERVGIRDNFFSIGGDSILSIRVVALLKAEGISLGVQDLFRHQDIAQLAAHIEAGEVSGDRELEVAPFSLLNEQERLRVESGGYLDAYPLSALQAGMVFHTQLAQFSGIYHDVNSEHVKCPWDQPSFEKALSACIEHHPILRSGFDLEGARALQHVRAKIELPLQVEDLRQRTEAEQEDYLARWMERRKHHVFDWARGPLFQINIFLRSQASFEFAISFHHSILDGWSRAALTTELYNRYQRLLAGEAPDPVEPDWTYRDFVALEQAAMADSEARGYFAAMLAEAPEQQLPRYGQRMRSPGDLQRRQGRMTVDGFGTLSGRLLSLSKRLGVPVQAVLLAAHFKVLSVLSGQGRVMSCVVANGRPEQQGSDRGLGLFLNSLPLGLELEKGSWQALIKQIADLHTQSLVHRRYPLSQIQQNLGRIYAEVLFNYMHFHVYDEVLNSDLDVEVLGSSGFEQTNFDFTVDVARGLGGDEMRLSFHYDADVFPEELVERIGAYYLQAFRSMLADPQAPHQSSSLLTSQERRLLAEWNRTEAEFPQDRCIHHLFEDQVAHHAAAPAAQFEDERLNYGQLNARANQLANFLIERGVGPDVLVGLCAERSLEMVIGILGIIKAGGAYMPLDPDYPEARLGYMLEDSAVDLVLTQRAVLQRLPVLQEKAVLLDDPQAFAGFPQTDPQLEGLTPSHLAYMIYTSGSTGQPKGVMVEHRALVNRIDWMQAEYQLRSDDVVLQKTPFCFDVSVWEFVWPLAVGASLTLAKPGGHKDPAYLCGLIQKAGVTTLHFVPSMLRMMLAERGWGRCTTVKRVFCSGEALPADLVRLHYDINPAPLHNLYGPTEAAIDVSYWPCPREKAITTVPIGRPIQNIQLHVLNGDGDLAPIGTLGELHIGGVGLGRGYLNKPELTAEKFIQHTFADGSCARLYKTGDLARWLPDGSIDFVGRLDDQIKLRGYRIELGEIESELSGLEGVTAAVVVAREDTPGDKRIVGYLEVENSPQDEAAFVAEIKNELRKSLPDYMVPSTLMILDALPLTANGKLDKRALPAPGVNAVQEFVPPATEAELAIARIWGDLLNQDPETISATANFFEFGGDSLKAVRLIAQFSRRLKVDMPLESVFELQTLTEQSQYVSAQRKASQIAFDQHDELRAHEAEVVL